MPGIQSVRIPSGATADRGTGVAGQLRFNTTTSTFECHDGSQWIPPGTVLQTVTATISTAQYTGATIPLDTSVPLSTEGAQFFTVNFTPLSTTSRLIIQFSAVVGTTTAARTVIAAIFAGTTNIGSTISYAASANLGYPMSFQRDLLLGSTAPTTISGRIGLSGSGNTTVNRSGNNTLGGSMNSTVTITEVTV